MEERRPEAPGLGVEQVGILRNRGDERTPLESRPNVEVAPAAGVVARRSRLLAVGLRKILGRAAGQLESPPEAAIVKRDRHRRPVIPGLLRQPAAAPVGRRRPGAAAVARPADHDPAVFPIDPEQVEGVAVDEQRGPPLARHGGRVLPGLAAIGGAKHL